jgi:hypothetical protein
MSAMYNDVYVRKNLGDTGMVPASGGWTQSPDIIPNGTTLIHDTVKTLTDSWNSDVGQPTVLNQQNYFYVRAKNLHDGPQEATFELYYCPRSLFLFPSLWCESIMTTSDGHTQVEATAEQKGDVLVPTNAFTNVTANQQKVPISDEHHCLIARVITTDHPNPLPGDDISDMDALAEYMLDNPNMAWRNVALVRKDIPTFTHYFDLDTGDDAGTVLMGLDCKNITVGSSVAFSCGDPIPSGDDVGKLIELVKSPVTQPDLFIGQMQLNLPAHFKTQVSYSYWAKPPVQSGWEVHFQAILITRQRHRLHDRAPMLSALGLGYGFATSRGLDRGIRIGGCGTQGKQ